MFLIALGFLLGGGIKGAQAAPLTEQAKLTAPDAAADDQFGSAVATSGTTAVVGAFLDDDAGSESGSAYVFVRTGSTWSQQQKLTASDATGGDRFGQFVALDSDTAVVSAPADDADTGAAYVFVRSGTTWSQQQKLTASDGVAGDQFGWSASIDGDTLVVGARSKAGLTGAAYVFVRSGTTWSQQQTLTASDGAAADEFGYSVSISGDSVIASARFDDDAGASSGSAYVFVRSGTTWTQQQKLTASDAAGGDEFGRGASISGNTAVVGALGDDDGGSNTGSAYVFVRSGTTWTQQQKLTASDAAAGDLFGENVAVVGDTAAVTSIFDADAGTNSGSVYVFVRSGTTWTEQPKVTASDAAAFDRFGATIGMSGGAVIVGAILDDDGGNASGSAYVYPLLCVTCPPDQDVECGTLETLMFDVDDLTAQEVTMTFTVDGVPVPGQTTVVPAGAVPTSVDFDYTFPGPAGTTFDVEATATNRSGGTASCTVTVTGVDTTPPVGTCTIQRRVLWPPFGGLLPVGLSVTFTDACTGVITTVPVTVYSDEPSGAPPFSPDAMFIAGGWRFRAERLFFPPANGRVYLAVAQATDAEGNTGYACCTTVVPRLPTVFHITQVLMEATTARSACEMSGTGDPGAYTQVSP